MMLIEKARAWPMVAVALMLAGCLSYGPQELSSMSGYSLCEMQTVYRANLSEESKRLLTSELDRRKEDCRGHLAAIKAQRDKELYDRTYGMQSP